MTIGIPTTEDSVDLSPSSPIEEINLASTTMKSSFGPYLLSTPKQIHRHPDDLESLSPYIDSAVGKGGLN